MVVIGGGITGLAAAHAVSRHADGLDVTLLEREPRLGGKILTEHHDGITYEAGADAFVARDPAILQLCDDLQLRDDLIPPDVFGAHIWSRGQLKSLPQDWPFGLPASTSSLLGSDLLPIGGRCRALWDLVAPGKVTGDDISIGELVRRRFGSELLERIVDPLLAGSRAGTPDDISLAAAVPQLNAVARRSSSIIRGLAQARRQGELPEGPPPFLGVFGGMQKLVQALAGSLTKANVRVGTEASRIDASESGGYRVHLADGSALEADAVIVATPAFAAADLLASLSPEAARQLYRIQYSSSAVAVMVYENGHDSIPSSGSGFLVPSRDHGVLSACTWFSKKWARAAPADGRLVVRGFVGREARDASLSFDDDDLIGLIDAEVRVALDLPAPVQTWKLYRWDRALPHYRVGHLQLVQRIHGAIAAHAGIQLAGAAYGGSGLPDCVRQGEEAAARALNFLADRHG
ncbi:MAG: protoporphyrinogen oxidase [Actinomycetota bacterium]|nr:protoporphyrinogen oxidase [Actinomycetota bacterium]